MFANSPVVTLGNATGLPISTGVSGLGTNVATFLATPSSSNLHSAVTDPTGTGSAVFANGPTITLANATGLPISTGVSGLGTNVATFLATPTSANLAAAVADHTGGGSLVFANSPVVTLGNATGLPISTGVSGLGTNVATFLATPTSANLAAAVSDHTGTGSAVFATSPVLGGFTFGGTGGPQQNYATVTLTASAVVNLNSTAVTLVSATSGYVIVPVALFAMYTFATTPFSSGGSMVLQINNITVSQAIFTGSGLNSAANASAYIAGAGFNSVQGSTSNQFVNKALKVYNNSSPWSGGGTGNVVINLVYLLVPGTNGF